MNNIYELFVNLSNISFKITPYQVQELLKKLTRSNECRQRAQNFNSFSTLFLRLVTQTNLLPSVSCFKGVAIRTPYLPNERQTFYHCDAPMVKQPCLQPLRKKFQCPITQVGGTMLTPRVWNRLFILVLKYLLLIFQVISQQFEIIR